MLKERPCYLPSSPQTLAGAGWSSDPQKRLCHEERRDTRGTAQEASESHRSRPAIWTLGLGTLPWQCPDDHLVGSPSSWPRGLCGQSPCASLGFSAVPGPSCRLQPQGRAATEPASLEECQHQKGLERSYPRPEFNNRGQEDSERWSDYPQGHTAARQTENLMCVPLPSHRGFLHRAAVAGG